MAVVWVSKLRKVRMTPAGFGGEEREWVAAAEVHEPRQERASAKLQSRSRKLKVSLRITQTRRIFTTARSPLELPSSTTCVRC